MTEIYIYGCECGINALFTSRVKSIIKDVKVYNTKRDDSLLDKHINYIKLISNDTSQYTSIVVEDNVYVSPLNSWV